MQLSLHRPERAGIFRNAPVLLTLTMLTAANLVGCAAIKGIFKAGVWAGVIVAVFVVMLVLGVTRAFSRH